MKGTQRIRKIASIIMLMVFIVSNFFDSLNYVFAAGTYTVTFNANGGSFGNGATTKTVTTTEYEIPPVRYSHTLNMDDSGVANSVYADNLSVNDVVTIPGATSLDIEVRFSTESETYDWLSIYPVGITPSQSNFSGATISSGKLAGHGSYSSYTKPSDSDTTYHRTFTAAGDTAQFYFRSDSSQAYYGYYAIINGINGNTTYGCSYDITMPVRSGYVLEGWYKDTNYTQKFDISSECPTSNTTLYAKWREIGQKDIVLEARATSPNQTLTINKYFSNAYTVYWGDGTTGSLTSDTTHKYPTSGTYNIVLSTTNNKWTFTSTSKPLVPKYGTTMTGVKITRMPSLADGFGSSATSPGNYFFNFFNYNGAITSLPEGSFDTSSITSAGSAFFQYFNSNGAITSLPTGSFNISNITSASSNFFYNFNYNGAITSLPEGSFDTSSITSVGSSFFHQFNYNGKLTSLPIGSFNISNITSVSSNFFYSFNNGGAITSLPEGSFDTSNITSAGTYFFYYFNYNGKITNLPDSFKLSSVGASVTGGYQQAFYSSSYTLNRNVKDLVNGVTVPSSDRNTFSDNQPGRCGVNANWLSNSPTCSLTITFNANGGSAVSSMSVNNGGKIILPSSTYGGYVMDGRYTAQNGGTKVGNAGDIYTGSSSTTLYAHWTSSKDIVLEATSTGANKTLKINKYFANDFTVNWGDGNTQNLTGGTIHTYAAAGTYTITLSTSKSRWTFSNISQALVPKAGTTMTGVKIVSMPSLADGFGSGVGNPGLRFFVGFNRDGAITSLPAGSFDTSNITGTDGFFFYGFNHSGALTSLPAGSFDISNIVGYVDGFFFSEFNEGGALTSLPDGSFNTNNITGAYGYFFENFNQNGALTSLPSGSFNTSNITRAGYDFFYGFNQNGALTSLPTGSFNTSNVTSSYEKFFSNFNYNGRITNLPASFKLSSVGASVTGGYQNAFNSPSYTLNKNVYDLVEGITTPSSDMDTFSDNQPGRCGVNANWLVNSPTCSLTITFNANGGNAVPSRPANAGDTITLPSATRQRYVFTGWYTAQNGGTKVGNAGSGYTVTSSTTLYAHWVMGELPKITFNANGGSFGNGVTTMQVPVNLQNFPTKYSHTQNIDDTGLKTSNYGNSWNNQHIRGTDRTTAGTEAHVLTITGASNLVVDLYYNGESTSWDWVSVWKGKYPSYTAASNATSAGYVTTDEGATDNSNKFGGVQAGTYTVNGNTLTGMGYTTLNIPGDSVTFAFKSDGSGIGAGYGYYAIVNGPLCSYDIPSPVRSGYVLEGWYRDTGYTQPFGASECPSDDLTLYAKWIKIEGNSIILQATSTAANQTLKINKYFTNDYTVNWGDGNTESLTTGTTHTYAAARTYTIILSTNSSRWTFTGVSVPLVPKAGTTMRGVKIISMPSLADGFGSGATKPGDYFFYRFNYQGAITSLPVGSFDTSNITGAGYWFFNSFNDNGALTSLPEGSFNLSNLTSANWYFFGGFNSNGALTSLPTGSFDISNIGNQGGNGFFNSFNSNGKLTSLPEGSFNMSNYTSITFNGFTSFNSNGALTSLPEGSFNTSNVTSLSCDSFAYFNQGGALTSLPEGSFNMNKVTGVSCSDAFRSFNENGALTSLPEGSFDMSKVTSAGQYFFAYFNTNGKITNLPASFKLSSAGASVTNGYSNAFNSTGYTLNRDVYDLVDGITPPSYDMNTFSDNQPGRCGVNANWLVNSPTGCNLTITFNTNGGDAVPSRPANNGDIITLPSPTKGGYIFTGWYTAQNGGTKVGNAGDGYTVTSSTTLYAHWDPIYVTFNANGGNFGNGVTTKTLTTSTSTRGLTKKYSHTKNIDDAGKKTSNYGNNWDNQHIRGTDRTTTGTEAHVLTFQGTGLVVDLYYNGQNGGYDWVSLWKGNFPSYTAASNYYSAEKVTTADGAPDDINKFGGVQTGTYTVNGNALTGMGHTTLNITGDSVTISFKSDGSNVGAGYGYYAIVNGPGRECSYDLSSLIRTGYELEGWYRDQSFTQPFDASECSSDNITVYAKWKANILYNINYIMNGGSHGSSHPTTATYDIAFTVSNPTRAGYTFSGWKITGMDSSTHTIGSSTTNATSIASTTETNFKNLHSTSGSTVTFEAQWKDDTKPQGSISTTSNLKQATQTATLTCTDNAGVTKYYWGTSSNPSDSAYTTISSTTSYTTTKSVTANGTYYLFCKDAAGNTSDSVSQLYYRYYVYNMLNAVDKAEGTYNTTNYPQNGNRYTYIAPANTTITFSSVYSVPTYSAVGQYKGWTTSNSGTPNTSTTSQTLNGNKTYYFWFNRTKYNLTLTKNTGIAVIYYIVNGENSWLNTTSTITVDVKAGSTAYAYATSASGYYYNTTTEINPWTKTTITAGQTFSPSATQCPSGYTSEAGATSINECYKVVTATYVIQDVNDIVLGSITGSCIYYTNQSSCTIPEPPSIEGSEYTVVGWYRDSGLTQSFNFSTPINGDITLYARYQCNTGYVWLYGDDISRNCFTYNELPAITGSDGTIYILMDRNIGARVAWNPSVNAFSYNNSSNQDTENDYYGYYYQWGNKYGFSLKTTSSSSNIIQATISDATEDSTYYNVNWNKQQPWSTNNNLWGDVTDTEEARQGPCPSGWHVPSQTEWSNIRKARCMSYNGTENCSAGQALAEALLLPTAGNRGYSNLTISNRGSYGSYLSSTPYSSDNIYYLNFNGTSINTERNNNRSEGRSVRCFKNAPVLSFDATTNGGTTIATSVHNTTVDISNLSVYPASRTGYTFVGWNENPDATTGQSSVTLTQDTTVYAIFSKTITVNFEIQDSNAATLSSDTSSCVMYNNESECSITSPTLTAKPGYTAYGWNTDPTATTSSLNSNTSTTISTNTTYYSVTRNNTALVATFYLNGASKQTNAGGTAVAQNVTRSCYNYNGSSTCTITTPTITPAAGFEALGYNSDANAASSILAQNTQISISANNTWYAITKSELPVTVTWNVNGNGGSNSSDSCYIYNGGGICTFTSPSITPANGFTKIGWSTAADRYENDWPEGTSRAVSSSAIYYAITYKNVTGTFYKNGAASQTLVGGSASTAESVSTGCTIWNGAATCTVKSPTITPVSGFNVLGYATTSGATSSSWSHNTNKAIGDNVSYYAITQSNQWTYIATYNRDTTSTTAVGTPSNSCNTTITYNGVVPIQSCSLNLTTITCRTASGYTTPKFNGTLNPGENVVLSADTTYTGVCSDTTAPAASVTTTNELKKTNQTATLTCTDGVGVTEYYWGTGTNPVDNEYIAITSTTSFSTGKTVTSSGTYYLYCKDAAGNVSTVASQTYYIYEVHNMLNVVEKDEGIYNTTNYSEESTYIYIAPSGRNIEMNKVYTQSANSEPKNYKGWTESSSGTPVTTASATLNGNKVYYFWFNRKTYKLKLTKNTGIGVIYYKINGASDWSNVVDSATIDGVKIGSDIYAYATSATGYYYSTTTEASPWTEISVNAEKTFAPNATQCPSGYTSEAGASTVNQCYRVFTVTFNSNGGTQVDSLVVIPNSTISRPTSPTRDNSIFIDWYRDEELTQLFDFSTQITEDVTLYAKWSCLEGVELVGNLCPGIKDIIIQATSTAANQTLRINKYFTNAYTVDWGDGNTENLGNDKKHTYSTAGTYTIILSTTADRWTFNNTSNGINKPLIPIQETNMTGVKIVYIPSLGDYFGDSKTSPGANYFRHFNYKGAVISLPVGSFDTSNITTAGTEFFSYFNREGKLTGLPKGSFNTENVRSAGDGFFSRFNYNGAITYLPDSFNISSVGASASYGYYNSFNSSSYTINRNVSDLVSGSTTPSSDRNTFSDNQPGRCGVNANWLVNSPTCSLTVTFNTNGGSAVSSMSVNNGGKIILPFSIKYGYNIEGWYTELNGGTKVGDAGDVYTVSSSQTLYVHWIDDIAPEGDITTTSDLKQISQIATLTCTDGVGVTKYYRGTGTNPADNTYTTITSTTNFSTGKTVTSAGTYYLYCKDAAGNVSTGATQTYYTYAVHNMQNAIDKAEGTYDDTNYQEISAYTYVAPSGTTITFGDVYTVPTYSATGQYKGYTTSASGTPNTSTISESLNTNKTYYFWFDRTRYDLTLTKNTGIATIYYKVNGASDWGSTTSSTTVSMKAGSTAYAYATSATGYYYSTTTEASPWTKTTITAAQTFSPSATQCPSGYTSEAGATTINECYKTLTATFEKNGSSSVSPISKICDIYYPSTNCVITGANITPASGFTALGWNTNSGATSASVTENGNITLNSDITYYAITQRAVKYTATFNGNGATASPTSKSCTGYTYNGSSETPSCTVTGANITRAGYTIEGWNTDSTAHTATVATNGTITLSSDVTYNAITHKTLTVTFEKNGSSSVSPTSKICEIWNTATNCTVTGANITPANGFTVLGWNTNSGATSQSVSENGIITASDDVTYYAITKKDEVTYKVNFVANGNTIQATNRSCTIAAVYNGASQATTCDIICPKITAPSNTPTVIGYSDGEGTHTNGICDSEGSLTLNSSNSGSTYYAQSSRNYDEITVTFDVNGNGGNDSTERCTPETVYNGAVGGTCTITSPDITPASGFSVIGWSTATGRHENDWTEGTSKSVSGNVIYYAQSSKLASAIFKPNGNKLDGGTEDVNKSCTRYNGAGTCNITTPTITASGSNTPIVVGYTTSSEGTSSASILSNISHDIVGGETYYAHTMKPAIMLTAKWNGNGSILSSASDETCTLAEVYDGTSQETSCTVDAPTVTPNSNTPTFLGFNTTSNSTTNNSSYDIGTNKLTLTSSNDNSTWYAITTAPSVTLKIYYFKGTGVSSIGKNHDQCIIPATYNGASQDSSCTVQAPSITVAIGYSNEDKKWTQTYGGEDEASVGETITLTHNAIYLAGAEYEAHSSAITYTITYNNLQGAINNNPSTYTIESQTITLEDPIRAGYTFQGWTGSNGNIPETGVVIAAGSDGDKSYNAVWSANTNTPYTVYHYVKRVGEDTYALTDTETRYGTSDAIVSISSLVRAEDFPCASLSGVRGSLAGTESGPGKIVTGAEIKGDESTKIYIYYVRNYHMISLTGDEHVASLTGDGVRECGSDRPIGATPKPGYHFVRWEERMEEESEKEKD